MQRQRKKDLNLKPNRVLDKRSSRGMIYENEELRLRTLAIADDVDRGHNDIKKLRKENDHLKRELWALRDECEKLEEILKRVISSGTVDPSLLPYPDMFLDYSTDPSMYDGSSRKGSMEGGEEGEGPCAEFVNSIFSNSDENEDTGSVIHVTGVELDGIGVEVEETYTNSADDNPPHHPSPPKFVISPDLSPLPEENENPSRSQSLASLDHTLTMTSPNSPTLQNDEHNNVYETEELPDPTQLEEEELERCSSPVIQIQITAPSTTPSSSSSGTTPTPATPNRVISPPPPLPTSYIPSSDIHDGGCITSITPKYEVTSQFDVLDCCSSPSSPCPSSPLPKMRNSSGAPIQPRDHHHPHNNRHSLIHSTSPSICPSCYHSEPSLLSGGGIRPLSPLLTGEWQHRKDLHHHHHHFSMLLLPPENVLAVGVPAERGGAIDGQNVIDELEAQWDPSLERVKGIRVLGGVVFLRVRDSEALTTLVDAFGGDQVFKVKGTSIAFHPGSEGSTELRLLGIGPEVPDDSVISLLNGFGQVISPIERRSYKGVEIWERTVRLHLVTPLSSFPSTLIISSYSVSVQILTQGRNYHHLLDNSQPPVNPLHVNVNVNTIAQTTAYDTANSSKSDQQQQPIQPSTPSSSQLVPGHKPVVRCSSSNPRLELGPSPASPIPQKRTPSASVCTSNIPPDQHPARLFQKNPNLHKTSAVISNPTITSSSKSVGPTTSTTPATSSGVPNSAPNLTTAGGPPGKKPLSRVLKSSPGNLVPPTPTVPTAEQTQQSSSPSSSPLANRGGGLRAAFYRGLSIDPNSKGRRDSAISNAPNALDNNNGPNTKQDLRRGSSAFYSRFGSQHASHHQPLSQMNSSSSSHNSYENSRRRGTGPGAGLGKGEPLPWCGCWGNGCI